MRIHLPWIFFMVSLRKNLRRLLEPTAGVSKSCRRHVNELSDYHNELRTNILPYTSVTSKPVQYHTGEHITAIDNSNRQLSNAQHLPNHEPIIDEEKIISVRITSSFAVDRGKGTSSDNIPNSSQLRNDFETYNPSTVNNLNDIVMTTEIIDSSTTTTTITEADKNLNIPPVLEGANMEYIKQLQAKKGVRDFDRFEQIDSLLLDSNQNNNYQNESRLGSTIHDENHEDEPDKDVPLARSVPLSYSSKHYFQDSTQRTEGTIKFTTVNFNVVHDVGKESNHNEQSNLPNPNETPKILRTFYNEPAKVYSQPAKVYSEPSKFYSEPAKIYSEPSKIYSEPAKVYSVPAKIYSEPAKFYSQPASLHLNPQITSNQSPWIQHSGTTGFGSSVSTTPITFLSTTEQTTQSKTVAEHLPEKNYEIDEKDSVITNGQSHGVQQSNPENCKQENCKVGYVVEGRQFRKYRVEERTSDGFIVGEYGVVRNEDGALRGVRYTADSEASPRLIHDALMKFLQLK